MPGDLITTSNAASASAEGSPRTSSAPSVSARAASTSDTGQNRLNASVGRRARSTANAARPSRPQPHSATRFPSSFEIFTHPFPQRSWNTVLALQLQQRCQFQFGGIQLRLDLVAEALHQHVFL